MNMNSKKKGNRYERSVAKWFTDWSGYKFERNRAGSGAWWTNKDASSDITCTDEKHAHRCKISIECKFYKDIKFEHILFDKKGQSIIKFWSQAVRDSERVGKVPILCMRYNSMPKGDFFFVIDGILAKAFVKVLSENHITLSIPGYSLLVFMASKVKKLSSYDDLHREVKKYIKSK